MNRSIVLPLRNTYVIIKKFKLQSSDPNLYSYSFIKGNDLPKYIRDNYIFSDIDIISIIDTDINNIYWDNRESLNITDLENLNDIMKQSSIEFEISNNNSFTLKNNNIDYNILYISVKEFMNSIENNTSIITKLPKANINIELLYELYDFWAGNL